MAVIITNMDMPQSCFECDKTYKWKKIGAVQCPHINMPSISNNTTNRPSYCPLKEISDNSVLEDIKAEVETDLSMFCFDLWGNENSTWTEIKAIIDKHIRGKDNDNV